MSNSKGTGHESWRSFDKLPKSAREALTQTVFNWAPYSFAQRWKRGAWKNGKALAKYIREVDAKEVRKQSNRVT